MQYLNAAHARVTRLHKSRLLERDPISDADHTSLHDPIHHADVLGESATARLEPSRTANFFIRRTLGERLVAAVVALATGNVMKDNYPVAYLEIGDPFVHRCDNPGSFMSAEAWTGLRAGRDLLQIRTAYTAGVDLYEQLPVANFRRGDGFQADVVSTTVYSG